MENLLQNRKNAWEWTLFVLWGVLTFVLLFFHEPWRDELQGYLLARDLSLPELFRQMRYEGHFILWFLFLKPAAFFHVPVQFCNLIAWGFTASGVWLILFRAPFDRVLKIFLIFSAPLLYWYPSFSRCYALIPGLLFGIAALYPVRRKHPFLYGLLIGLLANTHIYMEGLVLFLFLDLLLDWKKERKEIEYPFAMGMILLGVGIAFVTVMQSLFSSDFTSARNPGITDLIFLAAHFPWLLFPLNPEETFPALEILYTAAAFLSCFLVCILYRDRKRILCTEILFLVIYTGLLILFPGKAYYWRNAAFLLFALLFFAGRPSGFFLTGLLFAVGWQIIIALVIHGFVIPQRALLPFLIMGMLYWISCSKSDDSVFQIFYRKYLILFSVFTFTGTAASITAEIFLPYSGYASCAEFIRKHLKEEKEISSFKVEDASSLLSAYTGKKFYALDAGENISFHPHTYRGKKQKDPLKVLAETIPAKRVFVMSEHEFPGKPRQILKVGNCQYKLIYSTKGRTIDPFERFVIYGLQKEEK